MTYRTSPLTSAERRDYDTWSPRSACQGKDPEMFSTRSRIPEAKAVCDTCPVRRSCLSWALETDQTGGVWGGLAEQERLQLQLRIAA
ncbi:WhiB family transcriptional regulator (plasmid) [Streptomyces sp. NBC_01525]|uniref:WhiB family transcriptional regulator n=1 Tax=Streptomyces sp. NBC_01525 TaxID=2903893 RepID=UPI002F90AE91